MSGGMFLMSVQRYDWMSFSSLSGDEACMRCFVHAQPGMMWDTIAFATLSV